MFLPHDLDEHFVCDHKVLMSADNLLHALVMLSLLIFRTPPDANIPVIPVERMNSFYGFGHILDLAISGRPTLTYTFDLFQSQ